MLFLLCIRENLLFQTSKTPHPSTHKDITIKFSMYQDVTFTCVSLISSRFYEKTKKYEFLFRPVPIYSTVYVLFPQAGDYEVERLGIQRFQIPLQ